MCISCFMFFNLLKTFSVQFSSVTQSRLTLCNPMDCNMPGFAVHHQLMELAQTHVHRIGDAMQPFILCHPLLLLPSILPSIRVFSNESVLRIRWPKYWSFNFSISPSNEYSGLISFRIDWFGLLAVQRTLKGLLQHHSSKTSILQHSAFCFLLAAYFIFKKNPSACIDPLLKGVGSNRASGEVRARGGRGGRVTRMGNRPGSLCPGRPSGRGLPPE